MKIRQATSNDYDSVWEIFRDVIKTGDSYVFAPDTPKEDLKKHWFADYMHTYVLEHEGQIAGTYIIKPNYIDLGAHVANGSYMVHPSFFGKGIGHAMCEHSLAEAKRLGFKAMQYNLVVSTNTGAIRLWKKFGFEIVGTLPRAFNHKKLGFVDAVVMYRGL